MLPTSIRPGRNECPLGQRVGGRTIHSPDVDWTNSPNRGHHINARTLVCQDVPVPSAGHALLGGAVLVQPAAQPPVHLWTSVTSSVKRLPNRLIVAYPHDREQNDTVH
jgi:hypothetical protein